MLNSEKILRAATDPGYANCAEIRTGIGLPIVSIQSVRAAMRMRRRYLRLLREFTAIGHGQLGTTYTLALVRHRPQSSGDVPNLCGNFQSALDIGLTPMLMHWGLTVHGESSGNRRHELRHHACPLRVGH
jgi:hypothetical protein